jgi:hypothetical protein
MWLHDEKNMSVYKTKSIQKHRTNVSKNAAVFAQDSMGGLRYCGATSNPSEHVAGLCTVMELELFMP